MGGIQGMKKEINIVGILVDQRAEHAPEVQRVISDFGRCVLGRFGIPSPDDNHGLITLVMECDEETSRQLIGRLASIPAVSLNHMQVTKG
jgi:putative iron-only hydrogenase system regulator